jgi:hypothetical protein
MNGKHTATQTNDDIFAVPEIDVFPSEVDTVVLSVYKAAIAGIELLDKQERARFKARAIDSEPGGFQERWWWGDQISDMKYHVGNMGLVSLTVLFDDWLARRVKKGKWKSRFEQLVKQLPKTPLKVCELDDMVTARDSIIHHRGKAKFKDRKETRTVDDRFLDFDNRAGEGRVAVEESLLIDLAGKLKSFVNLWNQHKRQQQ